MRFVPLRCVKEGSYLAKDLFDSDGRILLRKGVELRSGLIDKIKGNGLYSVYIHDDYSDNDIEDIIKPQLRIKTVNAIKQAFKDIDPNNSKSGIKSNRYKGINKNPMENVFDIAKDLLDEIVSSRNIMINLVDIKNMDNYLYEHSVNTTILSIVLGIELSLNKNELLNLSIGSLLHDIGKAFLPRELFEKKNLSEDEEKLLRSHAQKGYTYLMNIFEIKATARIVSLQHHENIDGSGYPMGISGDNINKLARIVAITNCYDNLTSDSINDIAKPPNDAIEYIMGSAGRYFDYDMVRAFMKKVNPYPPGTLVKLSNGLIGVVEENNDNYPLRPKVRIVRQLATTVEMKIVDLLKENSLIIDGIQYEIPNPSVQNYLKNK